MATLSYCSPLNTLSLQLIHHNNLGAMGGADKELYKLELLSLVSRISQELFNHTKLQDKSLAEFVISVSLQSIFS